MPFTVNLRSREQILGQLLRTFMINSDINDVAPGSSLAVMFEAIASAIYQTEVSSLKILENSNLEKLVGNALDEKAVSIKIPNGVGGIGRKPASQASGKIRVGSSFEKVSSKLYAGKPAPFSGSSTLYLENASSFTPTGSIYLGRGTVDRFEGPIPYTSVTNNGSFWTVTLSSPLTKSHLHSDLVVLSQGGDRTVPAGTTIYIPANSQSPAIAFTINQDLNIPDGEAEGEVNATCAQFGEVGNALAGAITEFSSSPFTGATVTNPSSFQNGKSSENDEDLRQRIKTYPSTLSRGTEGAILAAITGLSDPDSGRTIQSAVVLEPVEPGDFARVYIDDGTGLEPVFDQQPYELLLQSASGQEKRFRTAQSPITPAASEGANSAPFVLTSGLTLTVRVDDVTETYTINVSNYKNINAATAYEIVRDLNSQSNLCGFRTVDGGKRIIALDLSGSAETLQIDSSDWQEIIGFPTAILRPIFVYKDSELQSFRGHTATLTTRTRSGWSLSAADLADVRVKVDGVIQTISVTDADFAEFSATISSASISNWATVLSRKIAGVKFAVSGQVLVWSTYQIFSTGGSLEILETKADGSAAGWIGDTKMWKPISSGGVLSDVGFPKNYKFNRFTGEINFTEKPAAGDSIEIGSRSTRAFVRSGITPTGLFSLAQIPATVGNARLVVGFDGEFAIRSMTVGAGTQFTPTIPDPAGASNIIRLTANSADLFKNIEVGDWLYLVKDASVVPTWLSDVEGFYRVKLTGNSLYAVNQLYNSLSASVSVDANLSAETQKDSSVVKVLKTGHGLRTGDLITISTSTSIGGISFGNLSVTNASVIVLDSDSFTYVALAAATSDDTGLLDTVGYNLVTVTHTAHSLLSGGLINVAALSAIGGISSGNLSVSSADITVINSNSYIFRALGAATADATGTLNALTYIADSWIEFEVSAPQLVAWTPLLSSAQTINDLMLHSFRSTVIPQLVDFGAVGTMTADDVVAAINAAIVGGTSSKVSPQQVEIRSNDFVSGTCAVLAVIGNASNLFSEAVASSRQAHIGNSQSDVVQGGFPVVSEVILPTDQASGYPTRSYLFVDRDLTDVLDTAANPSIESPASYITDYPEGFQQVWMTGRMSGLSGRVYNNQTTAPFSGILRGEKMIKALNTLDTEQTSPSTLDRYANFGLRLSDAALNNYNKLVVEMDLDPTDKTVVIPMAKVALIQDIDAIAGSGKGQVISFRLKDPEDGNKPFFDSTSVYKDFDFSDFKLLTKSVGLYREDVSDRALVLRSVEFGGSSRLRLSIKFPQQAAQADFIITHFNDFSNGEGRLNLIVTLPSQALIAGTLLSSGNFNITPTASGTLYDWRISAGSLNSLSNYATGNVLNISGTSAVAESYEILSSSYNAWLSASVTVTNSSNVVAVNVVGHGLQTGDLVTTTSTVVVGGISAVNLSQTNTPITVVNANQFTYVAGASATSSTSGNIDSVTVGSVTVKSPGTAGMTGPTIFNASTSQISSWALLDKTWQDLATAINEYYSDNPVATGEAIGSAFVANPIAHPTYVVYPAASAYAGDDMTGAFTHHSFDTKLSGSAGIWQYDSSNSLLNNIKATVQTDESIFPTVTEALGTTYSPINEEVYVVPTNTKTITAWMNFNAASSLNLVSSIERIQSDDTIQLSSKEDGSLGAVRVTGVAANKVDTSVVGSAIVDVDSSKVSILSADAKPLLRKTIVKLQNSVASEILRPYRSVPEGSSVTIANTTNVNPYFRATNSIKYIRVNANTGRLVFYRSGQGALQSEPLEAGNNITLTNLGNGLVQVTGAQGSGSLGSGKLSARVGDMMYVQPTSNFAADVRSKALPTSGITDGSDPEYLGYPVVHVIDANNIIVLAPNITTFGTTSLVGANSGTWVVFLPAIWNEKNIRTNHAEGAVFDSLVNSGRAYFLIKKLGHGIVSLWLQNSASEATDTMRLDDLSVSIDDKVVLGEGFDPANQGTFQILAHNGRNHILFHNAEGGKDELIDTDTLSNGGSGDRKWRVGPLTSGVSRSLRVLAAESVNLGDYLRISTPSDTAQWFNSAFFGSWKISGIGLIAKSFVEGSALSASVIIGSSLVTVTHTSHGYASGDYVNVLTTTAIGGISGANLSGSYEITVVNANTYTYNASSVASSTAAGVLDSVNKIPSTTSSGTYDQTQVCPYVDFEIANAPISITNTSGAPIDQFLIGTNADAIGFTEGTPFTAFRMIAGHAPNPINAENADLFLVPEVNTSKISSTFGTIISALHKIGFPERTLQGIDGYKTFAELILQAHRVIDSLPKNTVLYPGVKAAGTVVEVLPPLIRSTSFTLRVLPKDGVTLNSITEVVKASVASYVNGLGVGKPVILSEIIRIVQSLPGVLSVKIIDTLPAPDDDRIVVSETEKAFVLDVSADISVG